MPQGLADNRENALELSATDEFEIIELVARYNFAIDHRRAEEWADVFSPDGELWADGKLRASGRPALVEHIRKAERTGHKIRHWPCNPVIEGKDDSARLKMYVLAYDITNGIRPQILAEYDDELVKLDGHWKFKVRRVSACGGDWPVHVQSK